MKTLAWAAVLVAMQVEAQGVVKLSPLSRAGFEASPVSVQLFTPDGGTAPFDAISVTVTAPAGMEVGASALNMSGSHTVTASGAGNASFFVRAADEAGLTLTLDVPPGWTGGNAKLAAGKTFRVDPFDGFGAWDTVYGAASNGMLSAPPESARRGLSGIRFTDPDTIAHNDVQPAYLFTPTPRIYASHWFRVTPVTQGALKISELFVKGEAAGTFGVAGLQLDTAKDELQLEDQKGAAGLSDGGWHLVELLGETAAGDGLVVLAYVDGQRRAAKVLPGAGRKFFQFALRGSQPQGFGGSVDYEDVMLAWAPQPSVLTVTASEAQSADGGGSCVGVVLQLVQSSDGGVANSNVPWSAQLLLNGKATTCFADSICDEPVPLESLTLAAGQRGLTCHVRIVESGPVTVSATSDLYVGSAAVVDPTVKAMPRSCGCSSGAGLSAFALVSLALARRRRQALLRSDVA